MPKHGRGIRRRKEIRALALEMHEDTAALTTEIKQQFAWLTRRRAFLLLGISLGVLIWIFAIAAWNRGAEEREQQAFRREIMRGLQARLCAEEIAQIRRQAAPVTRGSIEMWWVSAENATPSDWGRAEVMAKAEERRIAEANRLRWGMVAAAHGLSKTEMTVLCGPQP